MPAATQVVSFGYGKQNYKRTGATYSAFIMEAPFTRHLPSKKFRRQGSTQLFPTSAFPDISGYMYIESVEVPGGAVVLLQSSYRQNGHKVCDGALFIAVRSTGPLLSVHANLATDNESTLGPQFLVFQGRGDVLQQSELLVWGVEPSRGFINAYMNRDEVEEMYVVQEIASQLQDKKAFELLEVGEKGEVIAVAARPGRRMRLSRNPA